MASSETLADRSVVKHLKEEFVSGLTGGSIQEINIVTLVALSSYAVWCALQTRFAFFARSSSSSRTPSLPALIVDFFLNWVLLLFSITIYASHPFALNLLILAPVLVISLGFRSLVAVRQRTTQTILKRRDRQIRNAAAAAIPYDVSDSSANSLNSSLSNHLISTDSQSPATFVSSSHAPLTSSTTTTSSFSNSSTSAHHPLVSISPSSSSSFSSISSMSVDAYLPRKSFLTTYRAGMMVITCIAILAVDFRIFPRRFAKVETWGTSLMDLGVGSFVFSMGLVSARSLLKERFLKTTPGIGEQLVRSIRQAASVLILGLLRLILVKAIDYQEHTSEYGVHWNFFMTLGLLPPIVTLLNYIWSGVSFSSALSLLVGIIYEACLDFTPLTKFILTAPRTGLLSMNKEGIFSFFGYLSIFLAGQTTGFYTLPSSPKYIRFPFISRILGVGSGSSSGSINPVVASRRSMLAYLIVAGLGHAALFQICTKGLNLSVSRRIANLPYVLWVTSYNIMYLLMYLLVEFIFFPISDHAPVSEVIKYEESVPWGLEAVNDNGLAIFLLANILTGAINQAVYTLNVKNFKALLLLVMYSAALAGTAGLMKVKGWKIKI